MLDARPNEGGRGEWPAAGRRATPARAPHALHHRRADWGAEPVGGRRWRFGLWAPDAGAVALDLGGRRLPMERGADGFWRAEAAAASDAPYSFIVDGTPTPDPLARAQAGADAMGPSRLLDPRRHAWATEWAGRPWEEAVVYELHVGTFTPEGTWDAARARLPGLAALGITCLEVMPAAHGPGMRGWGYDGCLLAAPHPAYGPPEAMKRFVEDAQRHGIMVVLDVVLNHFAPEGSDLRRVAPRFFDEAVATPWGGAPAFREAPVRAFMRDVVLGWLAEYRLDGLRFDAAHQMRDPRSAVPIMEELAAAVRALDWGRPIHLIIENEPRDPWLLTRGHTAQWADDLHHSMHVLLTGEAGDFLAKYGDDPLAKVMRVLALGFAAEEDTAPAPVDGLPVYGLPWSAFVVHNQNHDQVGNRPDGGRLVTLIPDERAVEVAHALVLLSPFAPMLFMGEEEGERTPFHYFCEVSPKLAEAIQDGRREQFGRMFDDPDGFPDPNDPATMEASRPFRDSGSARAARWRDLTTRLLALRHGRIVPLLVSGRAGPAVVERRGAAALSATWPFRDGFVVAHVNLGAPPDEPPAVTAPADFALGDVARDPFAIAVVVSRA